MKPHKAAKLLEQAAASQQAGNLQHAVQCYQKYLKEAPDNAPVLHALGGLYYQLQRNDLAGKYLEHAWRKDPANPDYLNDLGAFHMAIGDYPGAINHLQNLAGKLPDNPEAHYNLGLALHGANRMPDAVNAFEEAIRLRPDYAAAHYNLGVTLQELGQYTRAEESLRRAIQHAPRLAQAHLKLGEVLASQNREDIALASLQKAYELDNENTIIIVNYAEALHTSGRTEESIEILRKKLAEHPDNISLMAALGKLLHIAGWIDESEKLFRRALAKKQDVSSICFSYARIRKFSKDDADIIRHMEALLEDGKLTEAEQIQVCFALGKIYDDCEDYDNAFKKYQVANSLRHKSVNYDPKAHEKLIDDTISVFNRELFSELRHLGNSSNRPIFIVSMPRSGTTLTEQILASHPNINGAGELMYFSGICLNMSAIFKLNDPYPFCVQELNKSQADTITRHYLELLDRHSSTAQFITDKMPGNYIFLGVIRMLFPNATIIHCRRHPLDVCLSIYFQYFARHHSYSNDLLETGHHYRQYARLMDHWREVLPGPYLEINYEDLISDQEANSRRLIEFCGLEWDESCLEFYKKKRDVRTASNWQVRQPMYTSSVGRWRKYEKYLEPLMQLFNEIKDE